LLRETPNGDAGLSVRLGQNTVEKFYDSINATKSLTTAADRRVGRKAPDELRGKISVIDC
jgi:hypothetical protein